MNKLIIPKPAFDSYLTKVIFQLERLRDHNPGGSTPAWLFFDLKDIMHQLESLTSARIEGNRTTIMNVVENVIEAGKKSEDESIQELMNIGKAIDFIEEWAKGEEDIDHQFIKKLHAIVVRGLVNDGSETPGEYRKKDVAIQEREGLVLPSHLRVQELMDELLLFINEENEKQYDLLKTAVAHHRFTGIHPFDNGNGRTVRLLTYAMLTKQRFIDVKGFRLLNPSAVFCMNRQLYYDKLASADEGGESNIAEWCQYVLDGIKTEIGKIEQLLDRNFAVENIIHPALRLALDKKQITMRQYDILKHAVNMLEPFQVRDIQHLFGPKASDRVLASRAVQQLRSEGFLMQHPKKKQKYVVRFSNNYLLRGVIGQLDKYDLLPLRPNN